VILADTSVVIDFLRGLKNEKVEIFEAVLERDIPFGLSSLTYHEVLQGARDEREFKLLKEYLGSQTIYHLPAEAEFYEKAARSYYELRRSGITIRSTIDMLIVQTALEYELILLHNDRDFDSLAQHLTDLRIVNSLDVLEEMQ